MKQVKRNHIVAGQTKHGNSFSDWSSGILTGLVESVSIKFAS